MMIEFPLGILVVVGLAAAVCVIAMHHVLSCVLMHETTLHDLRNHVEQLQNDYTLHCAKMNGDLSGDSIEVTIIDPETGQPEPGQNIAESAIAVEQGSEPAAPASNPEIGNAPEGSIPGEQMNPSAEAA
jgi:hypothetical protein